MVCRKCGKPGFRICNSCKKLQDKNYFKKNVVEKSSSASKRKRDILEWYRTLKNGKYCQAGLQGCSGGPFHFCQLDYDHILSRGKKVMDVSKLVRLGYEKEKIQAEILKCDLICKCCHAMRTFMRLTNQKVPNSYE